jgi:ubiquinone/menaquinone biosynthesis C-methylase UbiE
LPTERETYALHAREYEALVTREDYQGNVLKTIQQITSIRGQDVVDLGAGTGRLACLLAPYARSILAFDLSAHMLGIAQEKLRRIAPGSWLTAAADHRHLPVKSAMADLIVSGWSVSYVAVWYPDSWRQAAHDWLDEARRVLRTRGRIILFESLGTGNEMPQKLPHLVDFYSWLDELGFQKKWIRTDYRFETPEIAAEVAGFFFGPDLRARINQEKLTVVPECTGVWWIEY